MVGKISHFDLFTNPGSTLTVGRGGNARLAATVNPMTREIRIARADQLDALEAIPLRTGSSDVIVREQTMMAAQYGMEARLAHYARNGGEIDIDGKKVKVTGYENGMLSYEAGGADALLQVIGSEKGIKFGKVDPPFAERKTPTASFTLDNVAGEDALHLTATVAASADVSYRITVVDGADQDAITAELQPRLALANHTNVDMKQMSVELKLNEPAPTFKSFSRAAGLESAMSSDRIGDVSEGGVSGVLTMPVRSNSLDLASGETKVINFAGAVNDTPNSNMAIVKVKLKQTLSVAFDSSPGAVGKSTKAKQNAQSSFEQSGTKGPQPAGEYKIYDGKDLAGQTQTGAYTPKGKKVTIPGVSSAVEAESKVTTLSSIATDWAPAASEQPAMPRVRQPASMMERLVTEQMQQEIALSSTSAYARTLDVTLYAASFDKSMKDLKVKVDGQEIDATYDKDQGTISFRAKVPANGKAAVDVRYTGERMETRAVDPQ